MKRLTSLVAGAIVAATLTLSATPAGAQSAEAYVCVGQGTVALSGNIYYPTLDPAPPASLTYTITLTTGGCVHAAYPPPHADVHLGMGASGSISGVLGYAACGQSHSLTGTTTVGGNLQYTSAGSLLVIGHSPAGGTGDIVGVANAIPNAAANQSCATGTKNLLVTAAVATA